MITRSNSKKIRENVRRLPHEVEATLPSWVKCTDPIPREILEEVRSTVLVWMKNVRNYVDATASEPYRGIFGVSRRGMGLDTGLVWPGLG